MSDRYFKSSFNVMNLLNVIPQGHEKDLKQALYNAVALFIVVVCFAGGWALFYILEPFVKPLIWALLIGSVLHPFKHSIAQHCQLWYKHIKKYPFPLCFGFVMIPVKVFDVVVVDCIGTALLAHIKLLLSLGIGIFMTFLVYLYTPNFCFTLIGYIWYVNYNVLQFIMDNLSTNVFLLLIIAYGTVLKFYWKEENKQLLCAAAYLMWFLIALFTARFFSILQLPIFLFILFALSFAVTFKLFTVATLFCEKNFYCWKTVKNVFEGNSKSRECSQDNENLEEIKESKTSPECGDTESFQSGVPAKEKTDTKPEPCMVKSLSDNFNTSNLYTYVCETFGINNSKSESSENNEFEESSTYIYVVVWACVIMIVWKNFWILYLLPIPVAISFIKNTGIDSCLWEFLHSQWLSLKLKLSNWIEPREMAIFPPLIEPLFKFGAKISKHIRKKIKASINSFASCLVIFGFILFTFCFSFFIIFQVYAEGIHLIKTGAEVVNFTDVNNTEFLQLLPKGWGDTVDTVLNDAYIYGRKGISKQIRHLLKDSDQDKAAEFEKHVLELWDRIYQAWLVGSMDSDSSVGPKVNSKAVYSSWDSFLNLLHKMPDLFNMTVVTDFAKENVGTLLSLLESVWNLVMGNLSLILPFLFSTLSLILGGGTAVLNFVMSTVVFFTALFYLLSSSKAVYKPVEWLSEFSPVNGRKLGIAFEAAVNGVFKASFKMAVFYGLWTWFIHNLFQVRIVYLPSVLAAVLGAIPFLGTFWASIPAVLYLWLAQQKGMQALFLFLFQCLPISFVDTAIYKEIKVGHPYMTGLAIAGGVFYMGIQGAIFGPLLLCCLLVALDVSSNIMKDSPTDSSLTAFRRLRREEPDPTVI